MVSLAIFALVAILPAAVVTFPVIPLNNCNEIVLPAGNSMYNFKLTVPFQCYSVTFYTRGSGEADLYVNKGTLPVPEDNSAAFDWTSVTSGATEVVHTENLTWGASSTTFFGHVHQYTAGTRLGACFCAKRCKAFPFTFKPYTFKPFTRKPYTFRPGPFWPQRRE